MTAPLQYLFAWGEVIMKYKRYFLFAAGVFAVLLLGIGVYQYWNIATARNLLTTVNLVTVEPEDKELSEQGEAEERIDDEQKKKEEEEERKKKERETISRQFYNNAIHILLLGFDRTAERDKVYSIYRPDTIMLVKIEFDTEEVSIVSVPRDSYVPIAHRNGGMDKINHSYYYGYKYGGGEDKKKEGIQYTIDTVSNLLNNVPIHYYVGFDMQGVIEIVDILGGIRVNVEEDIRADYGEGRLLVPKGDRILNGQEFLYYATVRDKDASSDINRIQKQQGVMKMVFDKFKSSNMLSTIPRIFQTMTNTFDTNLTLDQIAALALFGNNIDSADIKTYHLTGEYQWLKKPNKNIYMLVDEEKKNEIVAQVFGILPQ